MERLKKMLRSALSEQAMCLSLVSGRDPELLVAHGRRAMPGEGRITDDYLQQLYAFLFGGGSGPFQAGETLSGTLHIANVGRLQLIAQATNPFSLHLYLPPQGQALFERDWQRLCAKPGAQQPQAGAQPRPAAVAAPVVAPPQTAPSPPLNTPATAPAALARPQAPTLAVVPNPSLAFATTAALETTPQPAPAQPLFAPQPVPAQPAFAPQPGFAAQPAFAAQLGQPQAPSPVSMAAGSGFIPAGVATSTGLRAAPDLSASEPLAVVSPLAAPAQTAPPVPAKQNFMQLEMPGLDEMEVAMPEPETAEDPAVMRAAAIERQPIKHKERDSDKAPAAAVKIFYGPIATGDAGVSDGRNAIDAVLIDLVKRKGSDLHLTCGEPLCFRIDGDIQRVGQAPTTAAEVEAYIGAILPKRNAEEFVSINDTDFAYEIRGVGRFRVNVFRDKNGVGSVMRHIPSTILTAEQLGLPPGITRFCTLTKGLVLVTGPTGSGKSTTLAAMIDLINKSRSDHILTVEDPIEFVHPQQRSLVNQREVHKHTGSFARALKAALREDPDIVLIGEMRDLETVAIAIETAETGHLVFGTLHTNTAVSTIDRIVDQFPTDRQEQIRMMLASSLKGVVAQTLLKKKGGGRCAAHEILVSNDAVSAMIREGKNHMIPNHMQTQKQDGNMLLNESLLRLVKDGLVDAEEAMKKAIDRAGFLDMLRRGNITLPQPPAAAPARPTRPA